jgi:diketogulonate reductase-like aldo/keto reductase
MSFPWDPSITLEFLDTSHLDDYPLLPRLLYRGRYQMVLRPIASDPAIELTLGRDMLLPDAMELRLRIAIEQCGLPVVPHTPASSRAACELHWSPRASLFDRDDPSVPINEVVDTMNDFIKLGFAKTWGVSNWDLNLLDAAITYATSTHQTAPVCDSMQMSLATPCRPMWPGTTYIDTDRKSWYTVSKGVSVFAYEALAKGFLTGNCAAQSPGAERADSKETELRQKNPEEAYMTADNVELRDLAMHMASQKGVKMSDIAIAYLLAEPVGPFVMIGTSSGEHWCDNIKANTLELSSADVMWLESGVACQSKEHALDCLELESAERSLKRTKHHHFPNPATLHAALPASAINDSAQILNTGALTWQALCMPQCTLCWACSTLPVWPGSTPGCSFEGEGSAKITSEGATPELGSSDNSAVLTVRPSPLIGTHIFDCLSGLGPHLPVHTHCAFFSPATHSLVTVSVAMVATYVPSVTRIHSSCQ